MTRPETKIFPAASTCSPRWQGRPTASPCVQCEGLRQWRVRRDEPAAEIGAGRPGARILNHRAVFREEKAAQNFAGAVDSPQVGHGARAAAGQCDATMQGKSRGERLRAADGIRAREWDHELLTSGIDPQRLRTEIRLGEAEHRGDVAASRSNFPRARRLGLERPPIAIGGYRHDARCHFQRHRVVRANELAHDLCAAQGGMTRERHFKGGREDAHARACDRRGQHECRFRQVELQRDRLHGCVVEPAAVFDDRERIAAKALFGKHVDDSISVVVHAAAFQEVCRALLRSIIASTSRARLSKPPCDASGTSTSSPHLAEGKLAPIERAYIGS